LLEVLADPAELPEAAPASELVLVSVHRVRADSADRGQEVPVALLQPEKLHARSVPQIIEVDAAASNIRRPRKAR